MKRRVVLISMSIAGLMSIGQGVAFGRTSRTVNVDPERELVIRQLSVVEDAQRTQGCGAWTFCRLMTQMAGKNDPSDFTRTWLELWLKDQTVNSFVVPSRSAMKDVVLDKWPILPNGKLDLTKAPFRLLAIVNRTDLRDVDSAGEGRFVFGVTTHSGSVLQFTVIFEYQLLLAKQSLADWSREWHALGAIPMTDAAYNQHLQSLTDKFTEPSFTARPNASAIGQVRTNDLGLDFFSGWEMREFRLSPTTGFLTPVTVKQTPDMETFNGTPALDNYILAHASEIMAGTHVIGPPLLEAGHSLSNGKVWLTSAAVDPELRHKFAIATCNGCHQSETGMVFTHIGTRVPGQVSQLSKFFSDDEVPDGVGKPRRHSEMGRRQADFSGVLNAAPVSTRF